MARTAWQISLFLLPTIIIVLLLLAVHDLNRSALAFNRRVEVARLQVPSGPIPSISLPQSSPKRISVSQIELVNGPVGLDPVVAAGEIAYWNRRPLTPTDRQVSGQAEEAWGTSQFLFALRKTGYRLGSEDLYQRYQYPTVYELADQLLLLGRDEDFYTLMMAYARSLGAGSVSVGDSKYAIDHFVGNYTDLGWYLVYNATFEARTEVQAGAFHMAQYLVRTALDFVDAAVHDHAVSDSDWRAEVSDVLLANAVFDDPRKIALNAPTAIKLLDLIPQIVGNTDTYSTPHFDRQLHSLSAIGAEHQFENVVAYLELVIKFQKAWPPAGGPPVFSDGLAGAFKNLANTSTNKTVADLADLMYARTLFWSVLWSQNVDKRTQARSAIAQVMASHGRTAARAAFNHDLEHYVTALAREGR